MAKAKDEKPQEQSPEDRLLAALDEVSEEKIAEAMAAIDKQIEEATSQLKAKRERLGRVLKILRGKRMVAEGRLGRRKKKGQAAEVPASPLWERPIIAALKEGPLSVGSIGKRTGADVKDTMERLDALEQAGKVCRDGGGMWKLLGVAAA